MRFLFCFKCRLEATVRLWEAIAQTLVCVLHAIYEPLYALGPVYETHGLRDSAGQHGLYETTRSGLRDTRSTRLCGTARSTRDNMVRSTRHTAYKTPRDTTVYTRQHGPV